MKKRIHFHSDCSFFAGCENMLAVLFQSNAFASKYDISFSYRYTRKYQEGLRARVDMSHLDGCYRFLFPDLTSIEALPSWLPSISSRIIMFFIRLIFNYPLLALQTICIWRLLKKTKPEVLHINNGAYPGALSCRAACIAGRLAKIKVVLMVVNNMAIGYERKSRRLEYPIDFLVKRSIDRFVTGSTAARIRLIDVLGLDANKTISIHNGIDVSNRIFRSTTLPIRDDAGATIFGVVALMVPRKGHMFLLQCVRALKQANKVNSQNFKLKLEGGGSELVVLQEFVEANGLSDLVSFVGHEKQIFDFISSLDALILPSLRDEDFPNVILESMALGKPVISSALAGTPEQVIDNKTGFLFEPGNTVQLGRIIERTTLDKPLLKGMGEAGRLVFQEKFSSSVAIDNYLGFYEASIKSKER